jgi:hypothetical protein
MLRRCQLLALSFIAWTVLATADLAAQSVAGVWKGQYQCGSQLSNITLTIRGDEASGHTAVFAFETIRGLIATGSFEMAERIGPRGRRGAEIRFVPGRWISRPDGYQSLHVTVRLSPDGAYLQGTIDRCGQVVLVKTDGAARPPVASGSRPPVAPINPPRQTATDSRPPGPMPGAGGQDSIEGSWYGVAYCLRLGRTAAHPEDVALHITPSGPGTYAGVFDTGHESRYSITPPMERNHHYPYKAQLLDLEPYRKSGALHLIQKIHLVDGKPQYMDATMTSPCGSAYLARFDRIEGVAGTVGRADNLRAMCKAVADWLKPAEDERSAARTLKVKFSRALASYNAEASQHGLLFADDHFRASFGVSIAELGPDRAQRLFRQIAHCAFMTENQRIDEALGRQLFVPHALAAARSRRGWDPARGIAVQRDYTSFAAAARQLRVAEASLADRLAGWKDIGDPQQLEQFLQARLVDLQSVRPSVLSTHLAPIEARLTELASQKAAAAVEARRAKAAERFRGVSVPRDLIPAASAAMVDSLITGGPVHFDDANMMFAAGMSYTLLDSCGFPKSTSDRMALVEFLRAGHERAVLGSDYSNPDIVKGLSATFRSNSTFLTGVQFARAAGCSRFTEALADAVVDAVKSNASDGAGGDPVFVRTCALTYDRQRCDCLASVGRTVIPDIYQRPYERELVMRIISGNPIVALQIPARCNIKTY